MRVEISNNHLLELNTYFLIEEDRCLVVDPGSNAKEIENKLKKNHLNLVGIVLTHAHFDHFMSCSDLALKYHVPVYVHKLALPILYDPNLNLSSYMQTIPPLSLDQKVEVKTINEETPEIERFSVKVFHVPGHCPDHICLYFKDDNILISGDALFRLSVGRSDFPNSNEKQLLTNIKNKLLRLPEETIVYPGHGNETTIGYEKKHNIYIR